MAYVVFHDSSYCIADRPVVVAIASEAAGALHSTIIVHRENSADQTFVRAWIVCSNTNCIASALVYYLHITLVRREILCSFIDQVKNSVK